MSESQGGVYMSNLLKRLEQAEREITRLRTAGVVGLIGLGLALLIVWPRQSDTLLAERFVLVDEQGRGPLASLEDPDGPGGLGPELRLYDRETGSLESVFGPEGLSFYPCAAEDAATCPSATYAVHGVELFGPGIGGLYISLGYGTDRATGLRVSEGRHTAELTGAGERIVTP